MPFSYTIDKEQRLIRVTWEGFFNLEEVNHELSVLYDDPDYVPTYRGLADVRKAEFLMDLDDLKANHNFISAHPKHPVGPWAVICTEPRLTAYVLVYEKLENGTHPIKVFSTFEAADKWLGLYRV